MKNLKKKLAIILSVAMVMCSTLPSVASEIEVIDETTKSKIEEQLREDLGEERANEILNVGENADDVGAKLGEPEETSRGERSSEPEEEAESEYEETESVEANETNVAEEETTVEVNADDVGGEQSTGLFSTCGARPEDEETTVATISEPEEIVISIASKSITDKNLYGADEPWMYWWLTDNEDGEDTKTINYSNSDPGEVGAKSVAGDVTVNYNSLNDSEKEKITRAIFKDEIKAETCNKFFYLFTGLSTISEIAMLNTSTVTDMSYMFAGCINLTKLDLSNFKTENVENMDSMFNGCEGFTELNLSSFKVHNVVNMEAMFHTCNGLTKLDLSSFITEKVKNFEFFLINCSELKEINFGEFNTSSATSMKWMFFRCSSLKSLDLSSFNTENVEKMEYMFNSCSALEEIIVSNKFVTTKVSDDGNDMFDSCTNLVGGAGTEFDASHTDIEYARIDRGPTSTAPGYFTDANWMYWWLTPNGDDTTTINYSSLEPEGVDAKSITGDGPIYYDGLNYSEQKTITKAIFVDEIEAETCEDFFSEFISLSTISEIGMLDTSEVTSMKQMFYGCGKLEGLNLEKFNTSKVKNMLSMFTACTNLTKLDLSSFKTENVENMNGMFTECHSLRELNLSSFNVNNVAYMDSMFSSCTSLTKLDLTSFIPEKVRYIDGFLSGCSELKEINFRKFNTSSAIGIMYMFANCSSLESLDLSSFNTENVEHMEHMFYGCSALEKIIVSDKFVTTKVSDDGKDMFDGCTNLVGGAGTAYDGGHIDKEYAHIDGGTAAPGYFTDVNWMYWYLTDSDTTIHFSSTDPGGSNPITGVGAISYDGLNSRERINIRKAVFEDEIEAETCQNLFYGFERLETIEKIENLKTSKVTNMDSMFYACYQLTALDVTNFDTSSVTNMAEMFRGCLSLKKIIVSEKFVTSNVISSNYMFGDCTNLVGGAGTTYDGGHTDLEYARIDGGPTSATPGYFTLYVPPTPPAPTPTYPQNYSSDRDGGGGGSIAGPLVDVIIPAVTYLPIVKNILAVVNNTTSKWTKDAVTNKHKLNIINQNGTETPATLGFYNYTNVVMHIVNNVPVQTQTNDTYVFDDKGNMITGWVRTADGKWYLFEYEKTTNEGKMVIGWKKVQGAWYYFGTDGAMLTNAYTPDGHYVGPDGKWVG